MPDNFNPTLAWQLENAKGGMRFAFPPYGRYRADCGCQNSAGTARPMETGG
jgi:hypothetical protein